MIARLCLLGILSMGTPRTVPCRRGRRSVDGRSGSIPGFGNGCFASQSYEDGTGMRLGIDAAREEPLLHPGQPRLEIAGRWQNLPGALRVRPGEDVRLRSAGRRVGRHGRARPWRLEPRLREGFHGEDRLQRLLPRRARSPTCRFATPMPPSPRWQSARRICGRPASAMQPCSPPAIPSPDRRRRRQ